MSLVSRVLCELWHQLIGHRETLTSQHNFYREGTKWHLESMECAAAQMAGTLPSAAFSHPFDLGERPLMNTMTFLNNGDKVEFTVAGNFALGKT